MPGTRPGMTRRECAARVRTPVPLSAALVTPVSADATHRLGCDGVIKLDLVGTIRRFHDDASGAVFRQQATVGPWPLIKLLAGKSCDQGVIRLLDRPGHAARRFKVELMRHTIRHGMLLYSLKAVVARPVPDSEILLEPSETAAVFFSRGKLDESEQIGSAGADRVETGPQDKRDKVPVRAPVAFAVDVQEQGVIRSTPAARQRRLRLPGLDTRLRKLGRNVGGCRPAVQQPARAVALCRNCAWIDRPRIDARPEDCLEFDVKRL